MATISEAIAAAVQHHQAGRLAQAEQIYRRVLQADPRHADAMHLLGVVAHQCGQHESAVAQIQGAIALCPTSASFRNNLGSALQALGRYDEAESQHREAVRLKPDYADAHNNLGNAIRQQGRTSEAVAAFRIALRLKPDYPEAYSNLGNALKDQDDLDEAMACYRRAIELRPNHGEAHSNLGNVLQAKGSFDDAIACYRRALELIPDSAEVHSNLGNALQTQGKLDEAVASYARSMRIRPNQFELYNNWANALQKQGKLDDAVAAYRQAIQINPRYMDAYTNLGNVLREQWKLDDAVVNQQKAVEINPHSAVALNNLGGTRKVQGRLEEAIACFEGALRLDANYAEAHMNLGNTFQDHGKPEQAVDCFERVVRIQPGHAGALHQLSRLAKQKYYRFSDEDLRALEQNSSAAELTHDDASLLHYAIATLLDDRGQFDAAFDHCRRGNELRRQALRVRGVHKVVAAQLRSKVDQLIAVFDEELYRRLAPAALDTQLPVFIVGMPRSGTTLMEQILASHPEIFGAGERRDFDELSKQLAAELNSYDGYPASMSTVDPQDVRRLAEHQLEKLQEQGGPAIRVVDKMPLNYHHLGLIAALFPRARVIHCRRNPLDTCLSSFMQNAIPSSLEELGLCYREYERLMDHWREVLPCPLYEINYEQLVVQQEKLSREAIEFCGLDWSERCLAFHQNDRQVQTPSKLQVRQPMYTSSVGRWKNYRSHLKPLFASLGLSDDGTPH